MKQNLIELKLQVENLNNLIDQNTRIQKIYSSPHFICFQIRTIGKSHNIYLGRGKGFESLIISDLLIPSWLRVVDKYLEFLRKEIKGMKLEKVECLGDQRLLNFYLTSKNEEKVYSVFFKGRNCYFSLFDKNRIFLSWDAKWRKVKKEESSIEEIYRDLFDSVAPDKDFKIKDFEVSEYIANEKLKINSIQTKAKKKHERKIENIKKDIEKAKKWKELKEKVDQMPSDWGDIEKWMKSASIKWKRISQEDYFHTKDRLYKKIKKLKKAESFLVERLKSIAKLSYENSGQVENYYNQKIINPIWKISKLKNIKGAKLFKIGDLNCGIGLTAEGNNNLRKLWGKPNDLWFHIDKYKGSHLIIKDLSMDNLSNELKVKVGSILRDFSKLSLDEITVLFCQLKHLKGLTGSKGKVITSKPSYFKVLYDKGWKEIISIN